MSSFKCINKEFLIEISKNNLSFDKKALKECKILKYSQDFSFDEILLSVSKLKIKDLPKLFIFIIELKNFGFDGEQQKLNTLDIFFEEFSKTRPLILQITSNHENVTKHYYREDYLKRFYNVQLEPSKELSFNNISTFLWALMNYDLKSDEFYILNNLKNVKDSSIIVKILRTLDFDTSFFEDLVLECAKHGTKDDFMAALDINFGAEKITLGSEIQYFLTTVYCFQSASEDDNNSNLIDKSEYSVLYDATSHSNKAVLRFLIDYCTNLIQQLNMDHQIEISTKAYETAQIEILCDLLQISDFPFPKEFDPETVTDERLIRIIREREDFHESIDQADIKKISNFIEDHKNLKFVYNTSNESALCRAIHSKTYQPFFYLKSHGYRAFEFDSLDDVQNKREKSNKTVMFKFADDQIQENVETSLPSKQQSIMMLITKSYIHNKKIDNDTESRYRSKIKQWYEELYRSDISSQLMDIAATCENLKIIYDFECNLAGNSDLHGENSLGTSYTQNKWIFIGAKTSDDDNREQTIKGIIIHEICHCVMYLVYENNEEPYYENDRDLKCLFNSIVIKLNLWKDTQKQDEDDECDKIISAVYTSYNSCDYNVELIVRVPNIIAHFDNNPEKIAILELKYEILFNFYRTYVMVELRKFSLKQREIIRKFNKVIGYLAEIQNLGYELCTKNDFNEILKFNLLVISTNAPRLLEAEIYNYLKNEQKSLLDAKNVFVTSDILTKKELLNDLQEIVKENAEMKIIVDCSNSFEKGLIPFVSDCLLHPENSNILVFIVYTQNVDRLNDNFKQYELDITNFTVNYKFIDLSLESKNKLLNSEINFQDNFIVPLFDLISSERNEEPDNQQQKQDQQIQTIDDGIIEIVDDQLLYALANESKITINMIPKDNQAELKFKAIFRPRNFIKKEKDFLEAPIAVTEEQLLTDMEKKSHILMSDIAGTGKTWALRSLTSSTYKKYPMKWITLIDLKQHIDALKSQKDNPILDIFIAKKILRHQSNHEANIFKKLYKNGKVCILLDGYDEIAPDYAEVVKKLIKSFKPNNGNQLLIASRDHFEDDLLANMENAVTYKLDHFSEQDGIDLIVISWILYDLENENVNLPTIRDIEDYIKNSPNFESYQKLARNLSKQISGLELISIGFPQFYTMVAEVFKNNKNTTEVISILKVYDEFENIQYRRWSDDKGDIRKNASIAYQKNEINFHKLHQYFAMKSFFVDREEFCDLEVDDIEWSNAEILACGLLIKNGEIYSFLHETFREYFAAKFLIRILTKSGKRIDDDIYEYLNIFLSTPKYEVVRMFMNEALSDGSIWNKVSKNVPKLAEKFLKDPEKVKVLSENFEKNFENLIELQIMILKNGNYNTIKNVLENTDDIISSASKHPNLLIKLQTFVSEFLQDDDLGNWIIRQKLFLNISESEIDEKATENIINKIEENTSFSFIKDSLMHRGVNKRNIFMYLILSTVSGADKIKIFMKLIKKYLPIADAVELFTNCVDNQMNIIHLCCLRRSTPHLKIVKGEVKAIIESKHYPITFKELCTQKNIENHTICHFGAFPGDDEFFKTFWDLLNEIFEDKEEMKNFIVQKEKRDDSFIFLFALNNDPDTIEIMFNVMKQTFNEIQFKQIMETKGFIGRNLLQIMIESNHFEKVKLIWKVYRGIYKSKRDLLELLKQLDSQLNCTLAAAVTFGNSEILEFLMDKLKDEFEHSEIRQLLSNLNVWKQNLFQSAAIQNKSWKLHTVLWQIFKNYFKPQEILSIVKHCDVFGENSIMKAINHNQQDVVKLIWTEIKQSIVSVESEVIDKNSTELCESTINKTLHMGKYNEEDAEILQLNWIRNEEVHQFIDSDLFKASLEGIKQFRTFQDLKPFISNENPENHTILWTYLLNSIEDREKLMELLMEKDSNENSFIECIFIFNSPKIIDLTLQNLKYNFNGQQFNEMMRIKGFNGRNLLQIAANESKVVAIHQILWDIFQDLYKTKESFLKFINEVDAQGSTYFQIILSFSSFEIFEFVIGKFEKILSYGEMKELLSSINLNKQSIFYIAACQNKSLKLHKSIWKIVSKYFDDWETLDIMTHYEGLSLHFIALKYNTNEVFEYTWSEMKKYLLLCVNEDVELIKLLDDFEAQLKVTIDKLEDLIETTLTDSMWQKFYYALRLKISSKTINQIIEENKSCISLEDMEKTAFCDKIELQQTLWKFITSKIENQEELFEFILRKDKSESNYVHYLVTCSKANIVKDMFEILQKSFNAEQYQKILTSKGVLQRNSLQLITCFSNDINMLKLLWKTFRSLYDNDEQFLTYLNETDENNKNIFFLAAGLGKHEILEFIMDETEKIFSRKIVKGFIASTGKYEDSLLLSALCFNKSSYVHEYLWKIIRKYFDNTEIGRYIHAIDKKGNNILRAAIAHNSREIVELTWKNIKNFISDTSNQLYYLKIKEHGRLNLLQLSRENLLNPAVSLWVEEVMKEYEINFDFL